MTDFEAALRREGHALGPDGPYHLEESYKAGDWPTLVLYLPDDRALVVHSREEGIAQAVLRARRAGLT